MELEIGVDGVYGTNHNVDKSNTSTRPTCNVAVCCAIALMTGKTVYSVHARYAAHKLVSGSGPTY